MLYKVSCLDRQCEEHCSDTLPKILEYSIWTYNALGSCNAAHESRTHGRFTTQYQVPPVAHLNWHRQYTVFAISTLMSVKHGNISSMVRSQVASSKVGSINLVHFNPLKVVSPPLRMLYILRGIAANRVSCYTCLKASRLSPFGLDD